MTEEKQEPQEKVSILKKLKINNIAEKNKRKFYKFAV
ncbi:TPA: chromosomal replication initiator DnaA, partial [Staphylococcus aureus]|nr:chromosomal replication initiator DnaA [Staphylococcus aureus]HCZ0904153.1 chromosomal replication initiator DnaA [Staphylococcus aureus]HDK4679274.1 chromosomal replication initiator DnaA [Staphylococcus aureus]HDK4681366.1 chromosomal replication initiator DnaA [Staphylococcus aureus]HDK4682229.1 chromosomal replication initiator DnaA [Staphylococcus aureus]